MAIKQAGERPDCNHENHVKRCGPSQRALLRQPQHRYQSDVDQNSPSSDLPELNILCLEREAEGLLDNTGRIHWNSSTRMLRTADLASDKANRRIPTRVHHFEL